MIVDLFFPKLPCILYLQFITKIMKLEKLKTKFFNILFPFPLLKLALGLALSLKMYLN